MVKGEKEDGRHLIQERLEETLAKIELKEGERVDYLIREGIALIQHPDVFAFSMDAVLLADFAILPKRQTATVLDLCSGNGAVAFLASTKTKAKIQLVEIQERLVDMAKRTIVGNGLEGRYQVIQADVKDYRKWGKLDSVDYILCNPPYFTAKNHQTVHNEEAQRIARHEILLNFEQLCQAISGLLKTRGKAAIVHRPERLTELLMTLQAHQLTPKRLQMIYPKQGQEANGVLIEVMKQGSFGGLRVQKALTVHEEDGSYTPYMAQLLGLNEGYSATSED